jgi:predicted CoA-binding protein
MVTQQIQDFLQQRRIAVVGVSNENASAANVIYEKLHDNGYEVYAVNPRWQTYEGHECYPDLKSIPYAVDAVMIVTPSKSTEAIVRDCADLGIKHVWMHNSLHFIGTSVSDEAVTFCEENGIHVIPGGCPMMFIEPVDAGHKFIRFASRLAGQLPT